MGAIRFRAIWLIPARPSSSYFEIMWVDLSHDIVLSGTYLSFYKNQEPPCLI
jgi:hypothetical protein